MRACRGQQPSCPLFIRRVGMETLGICHQVHTQRVQAPHEFMTWDTPIVGFRVYTPIVGFRVYSSIVGFRV